MRIRIDLAYDGGSFHGWAVQPGLRTVQGQLEDALAMALRRPRIPVTCAGRTDTGVHARGQVAHADVAADRIGEAIAAAFHAAGADGAASIERVWRSRFSQPPSGGRERCDLERRVGAERRPADHGRGEAKHDPDLAHWKMRSDVK